MPLFCFYAFATRAMALLPLLLAAAIIRFADADVYAIMPPPIFRYYYFRHYFSSPPPIFAIFDAMTLAGDAAAIICYIIADAIR
jgi:hypothetical protein